MLQSATEIRPSIVHWRLRMSRRILTLLAIMLALYVPAFAEEHPEHAAPAKAKSATLMTGYGNWHHPVSTKNAQAQQFFDQGLRQIYAFNHDEAARSFQLAADLYRKLAMAYLGVADAVRPNYNDPARHRPFAPDQPAIRQAVDLSGRASPSDHAY